MSELRFSFTDEQEQFRDMVRRFLDARSPRTEVRRLMVTERGYDPEVWQRLTRELGLAGILVPEAYGGSGFGTVELGIVMEEMGRALLCAPYLSSSVLATSAILNAGSEDQKQSLLPGLASGERFATLAIAERGAGWDTTRLTSRAESDGGAFRLHGAKDFVLDAHLADDVIVAARLDGDGPLALFHVPAGSDGFACRAQPSIDETRKLCRVELEGVRAVPLGAVEDGETAIDRTLDEAVAALASEMAGGAQALLDSAVSYAKMRVQFGRTIGSFQAIKHKCADLLLEVESAKSAAYVAAQAVAAGAEDASALASLGKAAASEAFMLAARECIQIHGGIGFTWENDTHLYFKRAKCSEVLLGSPAYHRERMLAAWGI